MIGKDIEWRSVSEASQAGTVVVCHEAEQEGGAVGMAEKAGAVTGVVADLWQGMHRFGKPPIEALDHAVGLRPVGTGGAVEDAGVGAEPVDGVGAGRPRCVSGFGAVLEAVGELGAIVGQDRVDRIAEGAEKAGHRRRHRRGLAVGDDLDMGEAADPLDGDEGEFGTAPELAEILEVDMDIAEADWIEPAGRLGRWASLGQPSRQAETDQAAPDRAPRQGRREAAAHHLVMSSRLRRASVRSTAMSVSCSGVVEALRWWRVWLRSAWVSRPRQRRTVVCETPSSRASSATEAGLAWI